VHGVDNLWNVKRILIVFPAIPLRHQTELWDYGLKCRTGMKADAMMADTDTHMLANDRSGA